MQILKHLKPPFFYTAYITVSFVFTSVSSIYLVPVASTMPDTHSLRVYPTRS